MRDYVQDIVNLEHTQSGFYPAKIAEATQRCVENLLSNYRLDNGNEKIADYNAVGVNITYTVPRSTGNSLLILARLQ